MGQKNVAFGALGVRLVTSYLFISFSTGLLVPKACAYEGRGVPYLTQRPKKH